MASPLSRSDYDGEYSYTESNSDTARSEASSTPSDAFLSSLDNVTYSHNIPLRSTSPAGCRRRKFLVSTLDLSSEEIKRSDSLALGFLHWCRDVYQQEVQAAAKVKSLLKSWPLMHKLRGYSWSIFFSDFVAAITLACLLVPAGIAFSTMAHVFIIRGICCAVFPPLIYCIFGSSIHLGIGPEPLTSILLGIAIREELELNPSLNQNHLASFYGVLIGLILLTLSTLRAGFIDQIISGYLLIGFITGLATLVIVESIPNLLGLGVHVHGDSSVAYMIISLFQAPSCHFYQALLGVLSLGALYLLDFAKARIATNNPIFKSFPILLVVIVISILLSIVFKFEDLGIELFAAVEKSFPTPEVPLIPSMALVNRAIPTVISIILIGFVESQSITKTLGLENGYFPSANSEMGAIGAANFISSFFGSYPSFGSLPRALLLESTGPKTTLVHFWTAGLVALILYTSAEFLRYLPKATIAAIVIKGAVKMVEFEEISFLFRMTNLSDISMFVTTFLISISMPMSSGIMLCLLLSTFLILQKSVTIDMAILGRVNRAGVNYYVDVKDHPEATLVENILVLSIRGPLLFYHAAVLGRTVSCMVKLEHSKIAQAEQSERNDSSPLIDMSSSAGYEHVEGASSSSSWVDVDLLRTSHVEGTPDNRSSLVKSDQAHSPTRHFLIFDFSSCEDIDTGALVLLKKTIASIQTQGSDVLFAGVHAFQHELFEKARVYAKIRATRKGRPAADPLAKVKVVFDGVNEAVSFAETQLEHE